ncbi:hypothetical protein D6792_04110 [Candidatus Parcubacteria bacterium]|nr:MAG: hypothetical protein D6792_04110 [Candidatus Parcubacteria bacterium]
MCYNNLNIGIKDVWRSENKVDAQFYRFYMTQAKSSNASACLAMSDANDGVDAALIDSADRLNRAIYTGAFVQDDRVADFTATTQDEQLGQKRRRETLSSCPACQIPLPSSRRYDVAPAFEFVFKTAVAQRRQKMMNAFARRLILLCAPFDLGRSRRLIARPDALYQGQGHLIDDTDSIRAFRLALERLAVASLHVVDRMVRATPDRVRCERVCLIPTAVVRDAQQRLVYLIPTTGWKMLIHYVECAIIRRCGRFQRVAERLAHQQQRFKVGAQPHARRQRRKSEFVRSEPRVVARRRQVTAERSGFLPLAHAPPLTQRAVFAFNTHRLAWREAIH